MQTDTPNTESAPVTAVDQAVISGDQSAFKEARRAERSGKPLAPASEPSSDPEPAKADAPTADAEASSSKPDADLSEAARQLRRNRADERKAKIQREIDDLTRQRGEEQRELERLRRERETLTRGETPRRPAAQTAADPNDPEPTEADFPDDYGKYLEAKARWAARDEHRKLQTAARERGTREAVTRTQQAREQRLDTIQDAGRAKYADFDVVVETALAPLRGNPRGKDVAAFIESSEKASEDVMYRLGSDPSALKRVMEARSQPALMRVLSQIEAEILAPKPAPKHISDAPTPPTTLGTKATEPADEIEAAVMSGDQARFKAARLKERLAGVR